jgi:hypothetical protein
LSALKKDEVDDFLAIFAEVIIWGAHDVGVSDLVNTMACDLDD